MKLTITDDELDKLNQLFKFDNIGLAIQLVKSLGYELEDVLHALYDKFKYQPNPENTWWVLNNVSYEHSTAICIRYAININKPYCLWAGKLNSFTANRNEPTLEACVTRLANILREHYDK